MSDHANIHPAIKPAQLQRLYQVSKVIHSVLDQQKALELIVREAVGLVNATTGSVVLINPTDRLLEIQAAHGLSEGSSRLKLRMGEGITGWVAQHGKPALVPDVRKDARYVKVHNHTLSELAIPLEVNGSVCGVINVDSDQLNAFSETDQALLSELASQAAIVIHNAFLYERSRIRANLFESLITVGQAINSAVDLDDALAAITREACSLMSARTSALQLLDNSGDRLTLVASHGAGEAYLNKPDVVVSDSFLGSVVHLMRPLQIENIPSPRPMTHDLLRNVITDLKGELRRVVLNDLKGNTFYAQLYLRVDGADAIIDARPSDAIALALRTRAPIFAEDHVIVNAKSVDMTTDKGNSERLQQWLENLDPDELGKYKM